MPAQTRHEEFTFLYGLFRKDEGLGQTISRNLSVLTGTIHAS